MYVMAVSQSAHQDLLDKRKKLPTVPKEVKLLERSKAFDYLIVFLKSAIANSPTCNPQAVHSVERSMISKQSDWIKSIEYAIAHNHVDLFKLLFKLVTAIVKPLVLQIQTNY